MNQVDHFERGIFVEEKHVKLLAGLFLAGFVIYLITKSKPTGVVAAAAKEIAESVKEIASAAGKSAATVAAAATGAA